MQTKNEVKTSKLLVEAASESAIKDCNFMYYDVTVGCVNILILWILSIESLLNNYTPFPRI